ncbi:MAG: hypothetical protein E6G68_08825 [Actinobacteria bacterium]|nr:MAG: hypothetical protein E6G68_08825 [Actinomycetota bacterium]
MGLIDEGGREIGAATSPPMFVREGMGSVRCEIHPLPLLDGIYFPVVAILTPNGMVRDHWRLERAIIVDHDGSFAHEMGPVRLPSEWAVVDG